MKVGERVDHGHRSFRAELLHVVVGVHARQDDAVEPRQHLARQARDEGGVCRADASSALGTMRDPLHHHSVRLRPLRLARTLPNSKDSINLRSWLQRMGIGVSIEVGIRDSRYFLEPHCTPPNLVQSYASPGSGVRTFSGQNGRRYVHKNVPQNMSANMSARPNQRNIVPKLERSS